MIEPAVIAIAVFSIVAGVVFTRIAVLRKQRVQLRERLSSWFSEEQKPRTVHLLKVRQSPENEEKSVSPISFQLQKLRKSLSIKLDLAGWNLSVGNFVKLSMAIFLAPLTVAFACDFHLLGSLAISTILSIVPLSVLLIQVAIIKRKFTVQLTAAIDLMVSVLRSGHSLPQCVKTVGDEIAAPCGAEFKSVLHRMNLGQPLADALSSSCLKFDSYELDLIRRAVSIQVEIGGSLAELLEKTNHTLKERLKLKRHIKVLTAQSRLTALIVGLLPFIMAVSLNALNPGYLNPLFNSEIGQALLMVSLVLQIIGMMVMRKLATVKV